MPEKTAVEVARELDSVLARHGERERLSTPGLRSALKQRAARQVYGLNNPQEWSTSQDPRLRPFSRVSVETLRSLARNYDILAACIAHLKSEVVKVPLKVVAKCAHDTCVETKRQVQQAKAFLAVTGGIGGYGCHREEYEALLLDDLLIVGAGCSFLEYATVGSRRDGSPDAVTAIDAATIRPLVTAYGFAPGPQEDCYEQWVQGMRVGGFKRDELIYRGLPIFARTDSPYWLSSVELLVSVVYTALRADEWNRTWLTDGNTPDWWMKMPETMSPDQIVEWLDLFDTMMAGNAAQRHKVKVTPGEPRTGNARKEADFAQFEAWLMQRTCSVMGVNPASIGHHSDTYKDSQEIALKSTKAGRVAQLLAFRSSHYNELLERKRLFDVEVVDDAADAEDAKARAERHRIELESGQRTLNETRREDGLEPYDDPAADRPLVGSSLVRLDSLGSPANQNEDAVGRALRRFEKKALNRLRENGSAVCGFEDELLPAELVEEIGGELERCESRAEVRRVFELVRGRKEAASKRARGKTTPKSNSTSFAPGPQQSSGDSARVVPPQRDEITRKYFNGNFKVTQDADVAGLSQKIFGRVLQDKEWGELAGAPDGSAVSVSGSTEIPGGIEVKVNHPEILNSALSGATQIVHTHPSGQPATYYSFIEVTKPGERIGQRMMIHTVDKARDLGMHELRLMAAGPGGGMSGYASWAQIGFNANLDPDQLSKLPDGWKGKIRDLNDLMLQEGGDAWWKANGQSFHGDFDLNVRSHRGKRAQAVLEKFMTDKDVKI